jgi:hypothetical protein
MLKRMQSCASTLIAERPSIEWTFFTVIKSDSACYYADVWKFAKQNSNEPGQQSPTPTFSPEVSPEAHEPPEQVPVSLDLSARTLSPSTTSSITYYSSQPVLDLHEPTAFSRYTFTSFLTPQVPRTPRLSSSGLIARSSSISSPK